jgi:hypothetical protein
MAIGSSPIEMMNQYKPGGTLTLSWGKISARLLSSGLGKIGWWTYQTFSGKQNWNIMTITAYQVCDKSITTQRTRYTAAAQQESLLYNNAARATLIPKNISVLIYINSYSNDDKKATRSFWRVTSMKP